MLVTALLLTPLVTAGLCLLSPRGRWINYLSLLGLLALTLQSINLGYKVFMDGPWASGPWMVDELSVLFLLMTSGISLLIGIYARSYLDRERLDLELGPHDHRLYHVFIHLFLLTMILVLVADSLGLMWIAIESTTLASALLVAHHRSAESMDAAWKYVIICSVGIALAFMGVILVYASGLDLLGDSPAALDWSALSAVASQLDPALIKLSFIFIITGYGTKAGLAPMHTWLPDAHSQAPSPVSAMLSGLLLNCAMYGIIRFHILTEAAVPGFSSTLLLGFGLLSMAVAAIFIGSTQDLKRLLAYSSIEHMGIVAVAVGIGGSWGCLAAVLHLLGHSLTKSALFLSAGDIVQEYGGRALESIKGLGSSLPFSGRVFTAASLGIVGLPPFPLFVSEVIIIYAALSAGLLWVAAVFLILLAIIAALFLWRLVAMLSGDGFDAPRKTPLSRALPMLLLLLAALALGLFIPDVVLDLLGAAASILGGGC